MSRRPEIIDAKTIMADYHLKKHDAYRILHNADCPVLTGGSGGKFLVERSAFEAYLFRGRERVKE
ncbi:hypothetical protein AAA081_00435 [Aedoeadaptatus acetigenes]|uniref:DNA-binding protein n=1 Tax=Aedoeadaptatus acetigenes TaxID=2981723 RepID=A0ABV1J4M6_9FIRM|nr:MULTISPECIES: hypothetical protein [Peptoniphilus]